MFDVWLMCANVSAVCLLHCMGLQQEALLLQRQRRCVFLSHPRKLQGQNPYSSLLVFHSSNAARLGLSMASLGFLAHSWCLTRLQLSTRLVLSFQIGYLVGLAVDVTGSYQDATYSLGAASAVAITLQLAATRLHWRRVAADLEAKKGIDLATPQ